MSFFDNITFGNPWYLLGIIWLPIFYIWKQLVTSKRLQVFKFPFHMEFINYRPGIKVKTREFPFHLKTLGFVLIVIALSDPHSTSSISESDAEGIDMAITLDVSLSMLSKDFNPDRITVAKRVLSDFISKRNHDRMALITFGGYAHTHCPLTLDHRFIQQQLLEIESGNNDQGTAIGSGIGMAVARLSKSKAKSKVLILVSDGVNNAGEISPETAGELAQQFQIKIYSIGVGKRGKALSPVRLNPDGSFGFDYAEVEIDETLLKSISAKTGGMYFRATSVNELQSIYNSIDQLEKTKFDQNVTISYTPYFSWFLWPALFLLTMSWILKHTFYKSLLNQ